MEGGLTSSAPRRSDLRPVLGGWKPNFSRFFKEAFKIFSYAHSIFSRLASCCLYAYSHRKLQLLRPRIRCQSMTETSHDFDSLCCQCAPGRKEGEEVQPPVPGSLQELFDGWHIAQRNIPLGSKSLSVQEIILLLCSEVRWLDFLGF